MFSLEQVDLAVLCLSELTVSVVCLQMAHNKLSEIHKDGHQWTICFLVSHKWHYRGGTDEGPLIHTDLMLIDSDGTHMHGQVTTGPAQKLKDQLQEGKVFVIRQFLCNVSKANYRPVESPFMVLFTRCDRQNCLGF